MAASSSAFVYNTLKTPSIDGITGVLDLNTGTAIASAATINLNTATGNRVHITGTTAITAVILTRGPRTVIFDGILTLTHNATTNNLPGAANITTAVGDRAIYESDGISVYCVSYIKVSGAAVVVTPVANGLVWLSTVTASAAATADIETTFNSTYDAYMLVCSNVTISTDNTVFGMRLKIAGAYSAGAQYNGISYMSKSSASTYVGINDAANTRFRIASDMGNAAGEGGTFTCYFNNPTNTTIRQMCHWHGTFMDATAGATATTVGSGAAVTAGALTGVRFIADAGTISGTFRLYGIANL